MEILVSHHFWQDGENATWRPRAFPYPQIEQELKANYAILEAEKPKWKKFGDITVFFDYMPTKDAFGRDIVPIAFAFVPNCLKPEKCAKIILPALARTSNKTLKLNLNLPEDSVAQQPKEQPRYKIWGIGIALLIMAVAVISFWRSDDGSEPARVKAPSVEQHVEPRQVAQANISDIADTPKKEVAPDIAMPTKATPKNIETTPDKRSLKDELCANQEEIEKYITPCPQKYFKMACNSESKSITYELWVDSKGKSRYKEECGNRYKKIYKDELGPKQEKLDPELKEKLTKFTNGEW